MKVLLLGIFLLLLPILAYAEIDECLRVNLNTGVPCTIISSYTPSTGCVANISIYDEEENFIQFLQWNTSIPFCAFTWNISSPVGTYVYNSSIESGVITLEREDNMLAIVVSFIFIIIFYVILGLPHKGGVTKFFCWGMALLEFLMFVWIIWNLEAGGSITALMQLNAIITLLIGGTVGIWSLFVITRRMTQPDEEGEKDDSFTKWSTK